MLKSPVGPVVAIADPLEDERDLFRAILADAGITAHVIASRSPTDCAGEVATIRPHLVLHRTRPQHTGTAFILALRSRPETAAIPILVVTSDTRERVTRAALAAGASDVVTLPVDPEHLLTRAAVLMGASPALL